MNILLIGHETDLNGASKSMLNIIDCLLKKNHKIVLLTAYDSGSFFNEASKRNIQVIVYNFERWSERLIYGYRQLLWWHIKCKEKNVIVAKTIASFAKQQEIDVIHSNTSVINIGALISKYSGIPHVWHIREFGDLDFDMHFYAPKWYVSRFMNKHADKFICISKAVMGHYSYLDSDKKVLIYNGISDDAVIEEFEKEFHQNVHVMIAGCISETKGQHEAVAACELLVKRGIVDFELFIAGSGKVYFDFSEELGEKVHLLGQVDNMREVRKHIDIELVCSKAEAFGRVTAEAMLAGIPVIGSNAGGTPELINEGVDGFLYHRGNIEMLANKLETLIKDKSLLKKIGRAAQEKAKKMFTIQRCVDEIEAVYQEVVTSK